MHAATAAERSLDGHRDAVLLGEGDDLVGVGHRVLGASGHRGLGPLGDVARGDLVAEIADRLRGRADPDQSGVDDRLREVGVLREEAVAGVDRIGTRLLRGVENLVEDQVRLGRRLAAEGERLVGELDEHGIRVGLGVDGDAGDAGVAGGADDADGDLTAVGDEDLGDLGCLGHVVSCCIGAGVRFLGDSKGVRIAHHTRPCVLLSGASPHLR